MGSRRGAAAAVVVLCLPGCQAPSPGVASPPTASESRATTSPPGSESTPPARSPGSDLSAAIRAWESAAGDHFRESARALEQVSAGTDAEDESAIRAGCERLHETNSLGLQGHLPTPDPDLTAELQRMIDDINVATHACLRFVLGRRHVDATSYQQYLARAMDHLDRAKEVLDADRGR